MALATGKLSPMGAYMSGKLKLSGKQALAQKLAADKSAGIEAKVVAAASERGVDGAAALAYFRSQLK